MAVYSNLLLSTGGGIISTQQLAPQVTDTATVLIGLGGTGVHCIRTIKTQVYDRLMPDDPKAAKATYEHIRFLGVDTAGKSRGGALTEEGNVDNAHKADAVMALDDTEFFNIGNANIGNALQNTKALDMRAELSWLEYKKIRTPNLGDAGAGGIRQVGRFMMMDKSAQFMARVQQEISNAKMGLNTPQVNVHVFAGLSGGTGSGCFLDVCYMLRHLANTIGGVTIFGYFFLPDVNLANIPMTNTLVRNYIPLNGYAAMQELDYCMNLQYNGGRFEQVYQGGQIIPWEIAPVNMCHLICATDANNVVIPNAYDYAMNVTAEYLMDFLTESNSASGHDLIQHLGNYNQMVQEANNKKQIGSNMEYCVIGASCASVPVREINTYLASQLFGMFSGIQENIPGDGAAEYFAAKTLGRGVENINQVYDSLWYELRTNADSDYTDYQDDWKYVRENGERPLVNHYTDQTAAKRRTVETSARSMIDSNNTQSLVNRVNSYLLEFAKNLDYGPMYAYGLLSATSARNLTNVVDGLIEENRSRWDQEAFQSSTRETDYKNARDDFRAHKDSFSGFGNQKRFNIYKQFVVYLEQNKFELDCYAQLDKVLRTLREQLQKLSGGYYNKLQRVMGTLLETFRENRNALDSETMMNHSGSFAMPMMTIAELKDTLDAEIAKLNIPEMMTLFMEDLITQTDEWIGEDEFRITRLVTKFFIDKAFGDFANRSITRFLKEKYEKQMGMITDEQLAERIYRDWMIPLTERATPLFALDTSLRHESDLGIISYLSYPSISAPIKAAAQKMHAADRQWEEKPSQLKDRIFVMCSAIGVPLCAYNYCTQYENIAFSNMKEYGRHYYEGRPVRGTEFWDWRKLPPIMPQSLLTDEKIHADDLKQFMDDVRGLYERAVELNVIGKQDSIIYEPNAAAVAKLQELLEKCHAVLEKVKTPGDFGKLEQAAELLENAMKIPMEATEYALRCDGDRSDAVFVRNIQEDHFVAAPFYQTQVRRIVDTYKQVMTEAQEMKMAFVQKKEKIEHQSGKMSAYCNALFTGVIELKGMLVIYDSKEPLEDPVILSKFSTEYPLAAVPPYQGYLSFQSLSEDMLATIMSKTEMVMNSGSADLPTNLKHLIEEELSSMKLNGWHQIAGQRAEKTEILDFLRQLKQNLDGMCMMFGIAVD